MTRVGHGGDAKGDRLEEAMGGFSSLSELAGRMFKVKRSVLFLGLIVVGISMLLWAGWHNLRERKLAMQRAQESRVEPIPDKAGQNGQSTVEGEEPHLRGKAAPGFALTSL